MSSADGSLRVQVQKSADTPDIPLPSYATAGAAGMDLYAAVTEVLVLNPGDRAAIPTGLRIAVPPGYEAQVRPRSGLARNHGIVVPNSPGTIDSDYRGEVLVLLQNSGDSPVEIRRGERIAQLVIAPVFRVEWEEADLLAHTSRGDGGFGHTGR